MSTKQKPGDGFFARDEDFGTRMDQFFEEDEQFLALTVERDSSFVNPKDGETIDSRTKIEARKLNPETMEPYGLPVVVKTLSQVIYDHAGAIAPGDFPSIVFWTRVPVEKYNNEATILRRVCPYPIPAELRQYMAAPDQAELPL